MPTHLPLTALRAFDAAARLGSFRAAAEMLALTPSAVSHQIRALERRIGVALFVRGPRRVALTEAGERLACATAAAFDGLAEALLAFGVRERKRLRIHSAPSFAATWLAPRLAAFIAANPDLDVVLSASPEPADLARGEAACDIVYLPRHPPPQDLAAVALGEERIAPLCAPALARRLRTPADLACAVLIHSSYNTIRWSDWLARNGLDPAIGRDGPRFDRSFLAIAAAVDGVGVALDSTRFAERELAEGRLVHPFRWRTDDPRIVNHALVFRPNPAEPVLRFRGWLVRELAADPAAGPDPATRRNRGRSTART